jgi:hypothetical protein
MTDWLESRLQQGYGTSGTASHIMDFKLTQGSIMGLFPGFGLQESLRKYATLGDYVPIGTAQGPGFGAIARGTRTSAIATGQRGLIQSMTQGIIGDPYSRSRAIGSVGAAVRNNAMVVMARYSSDPRLAGGAILAREEAFAGMYKYNVGDIVFNQGNLASVITDDKRRAQIMGKLASGGGTLSRQEMMSIYSASLTKNADYQALLGEGLSPEQALKRLKKRIPTNYNRIMSVAREGDDTRLFFAGRSKFGAGSKVVVNQRKAIMGFAGGLPTGADIVIGHWNKQEVGRNLSRVYEAAEIWLTNARFQQSARKALDNAQLIANIANDEMRIGNIRAKAKAISTAQGASIYLPESFKFNQSFIQRITGLLSSAQQAELGKVDPTIPAYLSALREPNLARSGAIIKYGTGDIAALQMMGQTGYANAIAAKIGASPIAQEYKNVLGYLGGAKSAVPGAVPISEELISDTIARVTTPGGTLTGRGNKLFDPSIANEYGVTRMLDLGTKVKVNTGAATREFSQLPILSMAGRQRGLTPGGENYANEVDYAILDLMHARRSGEQMAIESASQKYINTLGNLGGKGRALAEQTFKTKLQGTRGTLAMLRPEAEAAIAKRFGEGPGLSYAAVTMRQAYEAMGGQMSRAEIMKQVHGEGIYLPVNRPPGFPQGTGFARLAIIDKELKKSMVNFGYGETVYGSLGMASALGGDEDKDPLAIIGEFATNKELQKQARVARQIEAAKYNLAGAAAGAEVVTPTQGFLEHSLGLASASEMTNREVALGALQKASTTGLVHNIARDRVLEGGLKLAGQRTFEHFTPEYINQMTRATAALSQAGIDIKQASKQELSEILGVDPLKAFYSGSAVKRSANITPLLSKYITSEFGKGINVRTVARDIIESMIAGGSGAMTDISAMSRSSTIDEFVGAAFPAPERITPGGTAQALSAGGVFGRRDVINPVAQAVAKTQGNINAEIAKSASVAREGVENFVGGLREGRGWTALAVGGAVLAGIGLSMRKPGNITVIANTDRNAQTRPDGSIVKQQEASMPIILPRKENRTHLMTQRQYDVRMKIRDVRKEDRTNVVDLGSLISGKYRSPAKVHVNISDDSRDTNYQQIFTDAYNRQMNLG